ncbi:ras-associated and pleckstrin homology domains-containing protein 1 isoform X2 [Musca domestica]|uniref:Ras-associated and pleckstrin homology domains-containing protein 1 isoform X2 n=1 Tax=Musca domestica TaxID=7370 RepID=A0ABM3UY53_MUSDO|nr:ras-associated and pleckstrin homology domains-containing protein 1 isoform X2 [Musca domestica]XP_058978461.1 ras-associated and pleckstrin homology domains-containing protein 1 isoform X2 [Musca domestica]
MCHRHQRRSQLICIHLSLADRQPTTSSSPSQSSNINNHYQQQQQQSVHYLDETIKNLTNLADTCPSIGKSAIATAGGNSTSNSCYTSPSKQSLGGGCIGDYPYNFHSSTGLLSSSPSAAIAGGAAAGVKLRKFSDRCLTSSPGLAAAAGGETGGGGGGASHSYRISMANLEETQESELDVILGELSLLEAQIAAGDANFLPAAGGPGAMCTPSSTRTHSRTNSTISGATSISGSSEAGSSSTSHSLCSSSGVSENGSHVSNSAHHHPSMQTMTTAATTTTTNNGNTATQLREPRTESPDNDSAFSDTVSLLSSESSASSGMSSALHHKRMMHQHQPVLPLSGNTKAAKIQLALHKLETAPIRRLFVKAFTSDGASKSLLVDERMTCGHVTRLLADKNHVQMQPNWALVENLGDLQMERLFEDHELLVDNLMTWNSDAGNRVLFQQRSDKVSLFIRPELYLPGPQMAPGSQHDEHTRSMLLEEFFETNTEIQVDGPLYMKADPKKGWKRYHFVLRSSGLYYFPKEKTKNVRDLMCLTLFNGYNVYRGLGWRKKWKAPTDYTFGFKSAVDSSLGKSCRTLKMLCAEDLETMEKWLTAIRVAKYGKQLWDNHKGLMEELTMGGDGISQSSFAVSMRSESISSISSAVPSQCGSVSSAISSMSASSGGRVSRASSSSSSGCLSDDNNGFDSEFTTGTIKRKPSMKPNLPLTTMTRQLKEVGENTQADNEDLNNTSPEHSGTLTRRHSRRKSQESNGSGTLKRRPAGAATAAIMTGLTKRGSAESMNANNSSGSSNSTPTPTPSICAKPLVVSSSYGQDSQLPPPPPSVLNNVVTGAADAMSCSTLSLDSLPPPPPPAALNEVEQDVYGSQLSLVSLPPPPPPEEVAMTPTTPTGNNPNGIYSIVGGQPGNHKVPPPAVPAKPIKPAVKAAPPYKNPPDYKGTVVAPSGQQMNHSLPPPPPPTQKKVSFADSPVLLRRKMHSPEPQEPFYSPGPLPPPRNDLTRLSNCSSTISSVSQQDYGSPKRLQESNSNPPRDFLKDLQRVMRKKWQVAQKCKLEPATTPHEVLGFRDFSSEELLAHNLNSNSHFYRETANVSNWVQEHYGAGVACEPPPLNEYALYENIHANNANAAAAGGVVNPMDSQQYGQLPAPPPPLVATAAGVHNPAAAAAAAQDMAKRNKRPPPPPPKRSDSTHLTHRV